MPNNYFRFKQFTIHQDRCAMKVTTDACLFGGWAAAEIKTCLSDRQDQKSKIKNILDIGTGTGLLSLMLAQKNDFTIDAVEIDKDAFEQARENSAASPWKERIHIYHSDAKSFHATIRYDAIISNPPFYENELKSPDEKKNIAHHGGLSLKDLLDIIARNLNADGNFYLLLPAKRFTEFEALLPMYKLKTIERVWIRQSTQHDYFRAFIKGSLIQNNEEEKEVTELSIWNEKKEYTEEFIELLKEYYLNM